MPPNRHQFYDPIIQTGPPPAEAPQPEPVDLPAVHGFFVELPGVFVAADDVSLVLSRYSEQWRGEAREALLDMARYFASMGPADALDGQEEPPGGTHEAKPAVEPFMAAVHEGNPAAGAVGPQVMPEHDTEVPRLVAVDPPPLPSQDAVALVEVYPDVNDMGVATYWTARPVDHAGVILTSLPSLSNVNHDALMAQVASQYPGREVVVGPDAMFDALWEREHSETSWNGRRRPSPRRMFFGA